MKIIRVVLTGGGTGGHVYPALAVADALLKEFPQAEISYIGTENGMENKIVSKTAFPFYLITAAGINRKSLLFLWKAVLTNFHGFTTAKKLLKQLKPDIVIATGGYVSAPVLMAAVMHRVPVLLHEQNAYPGITNKWISPFVKTVCLTFEEAGKYFSKNCKKVLTGLPVRDCIIRESNKARIPHQDKLLLVMGGSQGSRAINDLIEPLYDDLISKLGISIIHMVGSKEYEERKAISKQLMEKYGFDRLNITPYIYNVEEVYAKTDLIIARAGASTISEILTMGIPSVLIPYPFASDNHQQHNAEHVLHIRAGIMLLEQNLTKEQLYDRIKALFENKMLLVELGKNAKLNAKLNAAQLIVQEVKFLL
ncbi:MAG: undecaprenyldiphospho-muramoylpentapeptide beta-N-acetylglucosaminyltransferase [Clostridia bacterium]